MKKIIIFITLLSWFQDSNCQNPNSVWCFGDSARIDFSNIANPQTFTSSVRSRGSCVSISDSLGNLLFYAHCGNRNFFPWDNHETEVWSNTGQLMQNTDSVIGEDWYHELCIIPKPNNNHLFYLFTKSLLGNLGMNYSIIDINLNGGLGKVTLKNVQVSSIDFIDGMVAVKNGNGRDWWLIAHQWQSNSFYIYSITPYGVSPPTIQNIGGVHNHNIGNLVFNSISNKLLVTNYWGLIEVFDFDRCSGLLSLYQTVSLENAALQKQYAGSSISPSGHYMYVSNSDNIFGDSLRLDQYDLTAPNIAATKINIYTAQVPASGGFHALAPDGKIYMACLYEEGFPYSDTTHNIYTDNLSVINYPDSQGLACNFQPFSFYLGGNRSYWGLPNNPDYDLGRESGSVCDTLQWAGINEIMLDNNPIINVYPNPVNNVLSVSIIKHLPPYSLLSITDMQGRIIHQEKILPTQTTLIKIDVGKLSLGVYLLKLNGQVCRFIKMGE